MVFFLISCLFFLIAIYPFIVYPVIIKIFPTKPYFKNNYLADDKISLIFCCHNEEDIIQKKIDNLAQLYKIYPDLEVLVYLDACTDKTKDIILKSQLPIKLCSSEKRTGKNAGLNFLMQNVTSDIIAFNDANTLIEDRAFENVQSYFKDKQVGCVCSTLVYVNSRQNRTSSTSSFQWKMEEQLKASESRSGSTPVVDGALFFLRRSLFEAIPSDVPNDMFLSLKTLSKNRRVISAPDVISFESATSSLEQEIARKIRIATRAMTCHILLRNDIIKLNFLDKFKYISHKYIRWFTAYWLGAAFLFAILGFLFTSGNILLTLQFMLIPIVLWYILLKFKFGIIEICHNILLSFVAVAYGVTKAMQGKRQSFWAIPTSSRK
jgi:cellulose synthase/poly-beta-1,6-N-acetylglucosamine synthase-like glycosyltransferase